jgi:hypothetical protein
MSIYSFGDVQKEYNGRGEGGGRGSFESRLREDTFRGLSAVNEEAGLAGGRKAGVEIVQRNGEEGQGRDGRQIGRDRNGAESTGAFKVWTMGLTEIVDGVERNLGQGEGHEDVATALNHIDERSRQHMGRLDMLARANVSKEPQRESEEMPVEGVR